MSELWVCPNCNILHGIEIDFHENELIASCTSCGVKINPEKVSFLDIDLAKKIKLYVDPKITEKDPVKIIYRWISRFTVGIILETYREDFEELAGSNFVEELEDEISRKYNITSTFTYAYD